MANNTAGNVRVIEDNQHPYPSVAEMRASQKRGGEDRGLDENKTGPLNQAHGHDVEIKYGKDRATFLPNQLPESVEDDNE